MSSKIWRVSLMLFLIIVVNVAQGNSESAKSPYGAEKSAFIAENNPFSFGDIFVGALLGFVEGGPVGALVGGFGELMVEGGKAIELNKIANDEFGPTTGEELLKSGEVIGNIGPASGQPSDIEAKLKQLGGINFTSIKLSYISVNTDSSGGVNFDFLLKADKSEGNSPRIDPINSTLIEAIAFVTGLDVPDDKFWVNLMPWEPNRIIDKQLSESDVGRIMLEADLQMKKDFSNYGNPCANETGKAFQNLMDKKSAVLVQECMKNFPGEIKNIDNVKFRPVTRHWIVPDKIYAYTNGTQIYIINATLTINSEPVVDHTYFQVINQDNATLSRACLEELNKSAKEYGEYYSELQVRMIQPYVIADVNHGIKYEDLRDVYASLALAQWYKSEINPSRDIFLGRLDSSSILKSQEQWSSKEIWERYVYSFYNGEYKCWNNTTIKTATGTTTTTNWLSYGGVEFDSMKDHMVEIKEMPQEIQNQVKRAVIDGVIDEGKDMLFGNRLHMNKKQESPISGSDSGSSPRPEGPNDKRTDKLTSLHNETVLGQSGGFSPVAKDRGNASSVTCPDGWMGPNEKGECFRLQIGGKN